MSNRFEQNEYSVNEFEGNEKTYDLLGNTADEATADLVGSVTPEVGESISSGFSAVSGATGIAGAIEAGNKATGQIFSNIITSDMQQHAQEVDAHNTLQHGIGVSTESNMISSANQTSISNVSKGIDTGSWFGFWGSLTGYALSNHNIAQTQNYDISNSNDGKVDPELYDTVNTGYASQQSDVNQSVMET